MEPRRLIRKEQSVNQLQYGEEVKQHIFSEREARLLSVSPPTLKKLPIQIFPEAYLPL
jgi:hypothetical protein